MKKVLGFVLKGLKWFAIALVSVLLLCAVTNFALTAYEKSSNPPIGKMMDVNGDKMHVYTQGTGPNTIVLMTGLGTASPVYDFMPLIKALEKDYTVCVVEPFGYGWSSQTSAPRTNESMIEETRAALKQANISPPYILVPHSISGIYALQYANTYPEEVKGVVGLDISFPALAKIDESLNASPPNVYGIANAMGLLRVAIGLDPTMLEVEYPEYTDSDKKILGMFTYWNTGNKTVENETAARLENLTTTLDMKFPEAIPVRMILSKESVEWFKNGPLAADWVLEHEKLVAGNKNTRTEILEGGHYIHYGNTSKIVEIINEIGK